MKLFKQVHCLYPMPCSLFSFFSLGALPLHAAVSFSQAVPRSHKYFSLPAGKSLDSKFPPQRLSYTGKPLKPPHLSLSRFKVRNTLFHTVFNIAYSVIKHFEFKVNLLAFSTAFDHSHCLFPWVELAQVFICILFQIFTEATANSFYTEWNIQTKDWDGNVGRLVTWITAITVRWIAMKICADFHEHHRMKFNDFGDPVTFSSGATMNLIFVVKTEMSPQLLHGLLWNLMQTFVFTFGDPLTSCSASIRSAV